MRYQIPSNSKCFIVNYDLNLAIFDARDSNKFKSGRPKLDLVGRFAWKDWDGRFEAIDDSRDSSGPDSNQPDFLDSIHGNRSLIHRFSYPSETDYTGRDSIGSGYPHSLHCPLSLILS